VAVSIELFYAAGLNTNLLQQILRLDDLLMSAPYFLLGAFLRRHPPLSEAFTTLSPPVMWVAAPSLLAMMLWGETMWAPLGRFVGAIAAVAATQVVVSLARAFFDRPSVVVRRLVAGSFVIYLFHLPILVGLYDLAKQVNLPAAVGFPLILAGTMGLSWAVWLGVERSRALNLLFNGILPSGPALKKRTARPELVERLS